MPKISISQLAAFTGKDRRTISARVADLDYIEGEDNAHLYDSAQALSAIYYTDGKTTLEQARTELALEQAAHTRTKHESERKERIPISIVSEIWDATLQSFASTLKAAKGKVLDPDKINELLGILRSAKLPLTW